MKQQFDPRLLFEANRSFGWIFKCRNLYVKNSDERLSSLLAPHMHGDACDLINPGLVLSACYIYFVYPRETTLQKLAESDFASLDASGFELPEPIDAANLIRHIRNSLSHGRFEIDDDGLFTLYDQNASGTIRFETRVHFSCLGEFAEQFAKLVLKVYDE